MSGGDTSGTLGLRNQGDRELWDDPDPRVKWALDLFDNQGYETAPYRNQFFVPSVIGSSFAAANLLQNRKYFRPMYAGLPTTLGLFALGAGFGVWFNQYRAKREAEMEAVAKHYIMLHPDRFPEPEMKKFGDKCVFMPWR